MYSELNKKEPCADGSGTLPPCAPLAVPYVPFQQTGSKKYAQAEALNNGTLFPDLNLPFHISTEAANIVGTPLAELQALDFVVAELNLYLDTHQGDAEAFELFKQYTALAEEGRRRYESIHGPLTHRAVAADKSYSWLQDPWPWNAQEGGHK